MPTLRVYKLFISHAWHRSEHYRKVVQWLDEAPNFQWENVSVPKDDPVDDDELEKELRDKMRDVDAFVILSGMYAAHSDVIEFELKWARIMGRPIIGLKPWGNERVPAAIEKAADEIVNWNSASLVTAIRFHAK